MAFLRLTPAMIGHGLAGNNSDRRLLTVAILNLLSLEQELAQVIYISINVKVSLTS